MVGFNCGFGVIATWNSEFGAAIWKFEIEVENFCLSLEKV